MRYAPIEAGLDSRKGANAWLTVGLHEGSNREIRRVMEYLGLVVNRLIRVSYGPFQLGALPRGAVEEVNPKVMRDQLGMKNDAAQQSRHRGPRRRRPDGGGLRIIAGRTAAGASSPRPARPPARPPTGSARRCSTCCGTPPGRGRERIEDAQVLDAFAGTGALGLEALSRGAAPATFLENDRAALAALRANIAACREEARCNVLPADAHQAAARPGAPAGLVFLDPPYRASGMDRDGAALAALAAAGWIAADALVCAEYPGGRPVAPPPGFALLAERAHGAAHLLVLRPDPPA